MAEADVLEMVPERVIKDIKRDDPHPLFKAFVVSHEGLAEPTVVGIGKTIQRWFTGAIKALERKLKIGTKVFDGHNKDNDHTNRKSVGEVIGTGIEKINDMLSAVAVTYIYPQFKDVNFNVASVEADIMIPKDAREFEVNEPEVLGVTGIALGDSAKDKPAFHGAALQVTLQAFAENDPKGDKKMTLEEIKTAIKDGGHKVSDVFSVADLTRDPLVIEQIEEKVNNLRGYNIRKLADAEGKVDALTKKNKELKGQVDEFSKGALREKGEGVFADILKERKLDGDKKFERYIKKMYKKDFSPTDETTLKQDGNKFIDTHIDEFKDLFGEAVKVGKTSKDDKDPPEKPSDGPGEEDPTGDKENLLDPKNNELIPED